MNENQLGTLGNLEKIGDALTFLGISNDDFREPRRLMQVNEVAEFLNTHPDPTFFVRKAVGNKDVDRISFILEYINLHKDYNETKKKLDSIDELIKHYEK